MGQITGGLRYSQYVRYYGHTKEKVCKSFLFTAKFPCIGKKEHLFDGGCCRDHCHSISIVCYFKVQKIQLRNINMLTCNCSEA